jgi:GxxExxY protein
VSELIYKEETFQLVGLCMEIHRELGKGHDEVIYKDALVVELTRAGIPFSCEKNYEITYKGVILPHYYMLILLCGRRFSLKPKLSKS